jgi:hypothetical protein
MVDTPYNRLGLQRFKIEWRRRHRNQSATEMEKEKSTKLVKAHQSQASFIASRGWKSSNSSLLPVVGEIFSLTFPFIEQAVAIDKVRRSRRRFRQTIRGEGY